MKSIRARIIAILLIGAMGMACTACGRNSDESSSGAENSAAESGADIENSGDLTIAEGEMLKQDMTISDYVVEDSQSDVPVNQNVNQNSGTSGENSTSEENYVVVTDEAGQEVTDENGNVVTQVVTGGNSGGSGNNNNSSDGNSGNSSGSSDNSNGGNDNSSNGNNEGSDGNTYTPSIVGKLLYWLDMSQSRDYVFNGDFVDVTFRVKDDAPDGNYTIGIGECDFANWDAETVTYTTVDGDLAIGSAQQKETGTPGDDGTIKLVCESTSAQQGEEVTVRFTISDNPGIVGLIFRFTFDQNALEFVDYHVGEDCAEFISLA